MTDFPETVLVSGYAQAPKGTGMSEQLTWVGVVLEVDCKTHRVLRADATFITELARTYLREKIMGYDLLKGFEGLANILEMHIHTPSKSALIVACQAAFQRYAEFRQNPYRGSSL